MLDRELKYLLQVILIFIAACLSGCAVGHFFCSYGAKCSVRAKRSVALKPHTECGATSRYVQNDLQNCYYN